MQINIVICNLDNYFLYQVDVLSSAYEEFETNFGTKEVLSAFEDAVKVGRIKCREICAAGPK